MRKHLQEYGNIQIRHKISMRRWSADCHYGTKIRSNPMEHIRAKHMNPEKWYKCFRCGKVYKNRRRVRFHEQICGTPAHLKCEFCEYTSNTKYVFRQHNIRKHTKFDNNDLYACHTCDKGFRLRKYLSQHFKGCGINCQCAHCPFVSRQKRALYRHLRRKHKGVYSKVDLKSRVEDFFSSESITFHIL